MNKNSSSSAALPIPPKMTEHQDEVEETITFAPDDVNTQVTVDPTSTTAALFGQDGAALTTEMRTESDYEMIDEDKLLLDASLNNTNNSNALPATTDDADYELDELEAEIARELED